MLMLIITCTVHIKDKGTVGAGTACGIFFTFRTYSLLLMFNVSMSFYNYRFK